MPGYAYSNFGSAVLGKITLNEDLNSSTDILNLNRGAGYEPVLRASSTGVSLLSGLEKPLVSFDSNNKTLSLSNPNAGDDLLKFADGTTDLNCGSKEFLHVQEFTDESSLFATECAIGKSGAECDMSVKGNLSVIGAQTKILTTELTIGDADAAVPVQTNVTIHGELNVTGSITTVHSTDLSIADKIIVIGDGVTAGGQAALAGEGNHIGLQFGTSELDASLQYDGSVFKFTKPLAVSGPAGVTVGNWVFIEVDGNLQIQADGVTKFVLEAN